MSQTTRRWISEKVKSLREANVLPFHDILDAKMVEATLAEEGITCSMSEVGQCWDNAPVESFFGRLKCEIASDVMFSSRDQARAEIFEYLEVFYNRVRRHSSLGFLSPVDYERAYNQKLR